MASITQLRPTAPAPAPAPLGALAGGPPGPAVVAAHAALTAIIADCCGPFGLIERDDLIRLVWTALVARKHVLLLGPPGTGKSTAGKLVAAHMGDGFTVFSKLLTLDMSSDAVLGPTDLPAFFERGLERRNLTGYLVDCHLAVLDEIGKANGLVLNALLEILVDFVYTNGNVVVPATLQTLVAISNEWTDADGRAAFNDRLHLRVPVPPLSARGRAALRARKAALPDAGRSGPLPQLALADLATLQAALPWIGVPPAIQDTLGAVDTDLAGQGIVVTDRRHGDSVDLLRASALVAGRGTVDEDDLHILEFVYWHTLDQIKAVRKAVRAHANPLTARATDLGDEIHSVRTTLDGRLKADLAGTNPARGAAVVTDHGKIKRLIRELESVAAEAAGRGRATDRIAAVLATGREDLAHVAEILMGLDEV